MGIVNTTDFLMSSPISALLVEEGWAFTTPPCAKPRMTQADKWKKRSCVVRYRDFKDDLRWELMGFKGKGEGLKLNFTYPKDRHYVRFTVEMPKSWSKRKRLEMCGKPKVCKPDLDNYLKGLWDALLLEDSHLWSCFSEKYWGEVGSIFICEFKDF